MAAVALEFLEAPVDSHWQVLIVVVAAPVSKHVAVVPIAQVPMSSVAPENLVVDRLWHL